jgi:hypothetical protein
LFRSGYRGALFNRQGFPGGNLVAVQEPLLLRANADGPIALPGYVLGDQVIQSIGNALLGATGLEA